MAKRVSRQTFKIQHMLTHNKLESYAKALIISTYNKQKGVFTRYLNANRSSSITELKRGLPQLYKREMTPLWKPTYRSIFQRCAEESEAFISERVNGETATHKTIKSVVEETSELTLREAMLWQFKRVPVTKAWQDHVQDYMENQAGKNITRMEDTDQARVASILDAAAQDEKGSIKSVPDILNEFDDMSRDRATTIARTEVTGAYNYAGLENAKEMVPGWYKEWNAEIDKDTRDWHIDLDGKSVPMDEPFIADIKGEDDPIMFPGDPDAAAANTVNCRCAMNYVPPPAGEAVPEEAAPTEEAPAEGVGEGEGSDLGGLVSGLDALGIGGLFGEGLAAEEVAPVAATAEETAALLAARADEIDLLRVQAAKATGKEKQKLLDQIARLSQETQIE